MIKKILFLFIMLMVAGFAFVFLFGSAVLNKGIKSYLETFGTGLTQTPVTFDHINISVFSGTGTLKGLHIGNPKGFKNEYIFSLEQIDLDLDKKSVFSDTIVINKIHIKQPKICFEKKLNTSNFKELQKNIGVFTDTGSTKKIPVRERELESRPQKQLVIKKLIIKDASVYASLMGQELNLPLPHIEIDNIGEDTYKQSIDQIIDLVLSEISLAVRQPWSLL